MADPSFGNGPSPYQQPPIIYGNTPDNNSPMIYTQPMHMPPPSTPSPSQGLYYFPTPLPTSGYPTDSGTPIPPDNSNTPNSPLLRGGQIYNTVKERLIERTYETHVSQWFNEAWNLFFEHWPPFVLFTVLILALSSIPYVGFVFTVILTPGYFICGSHYLRNGRNHFKPVTLFHTVYYTLPVLLISLIVSLLIAIGLFLLILPGIYLSVVLCMAIPLYIEYHHEGLSLWDSLSVSLKVLKQHPLNMFGFILLQFLLVFFGLLCFIIPALITMPVAYLMNVFAFRDIFGLSDNKLEDRQCTFC